MNKTKKMAFGIGVVLTVLAVLTVSAAADEYFYLLPEDSNCTEVGCTTTVLAMVHTDRSDIGSSQIHLEFDPSIVNITNIEAPTDPTWHMWLWKHEGDYVFAVGNHFGGVGPGELQVGKMTLECKNPGVSPLEYTHFYPQTPDPTAIATTLGGNCPATAINGTYTCTAPTYTISGTVPGVDTVKITNLNKPDAVDDIPADYIDPVTGFYNLTLNVPDEVDTGDKLRIIACDTPDNYTSNCNRTDHTVVDISGETVNLTLNHYCQNYYPSFPFHTWNESNWSGPAAMEMLIDNYRDTSDVPNQTVLNATGLSYNQACNADILFVDPLGMKSTLNLYLHTYEGLQYVANYGIGHYDTIEEVLHYICKWQYLGPGAAPAYGNYSNWMVIRGIHTNKTPSFTQGSYEIYGFWINDPYNTSLEGPGGIGENTYKSVDQWSSIYHKKLNESGINTSDNYYNEYVAVCEPPEDDDVVVTLAHAKPRFADAIAPMLAEEPMMLYGIEQLALEKVVKDDELLKIVKAAIDGVNEELVPFDSEFAAVFAKTVPGKPKLVTSDNGDYYVVPFNVPVKERPPVKRMPVEIERPKISGLKKLERMKRVADRIELKPIPIEPIRVEKTLVVVLVDAEDGSFKEASWVADPVKYLPVSRIAAMKLALGEVLDELNIVAKKDARDLEVIQQRPTIELVYMDASPYYPDWKVTVNGEVFYVSQDGTVSA